MRAHGVIVNDVLKKFDRSSAHDIIATVDDGRDKATLILRITGVISCLNIEYPKECHADSRIIILTSSDVWNTYSDIQNRIPELHLLQHVQTIIQDNLKLSELIQVSL